MKSMKKNISENCQIEIRDYGSRVGGYGEHIEIVTRTNNGSFEIAFTRKELEELSNLIRNFLGNLNDGELDKRSDP